MAKARNKTKRENLSAAEKLITARFDELMARMAFVRKEDVELYLAGHGGRHPPRFDFNEAKVVEVVTMAAHAWRGITPFYLAKVLFFADRDHLRAYGRPVTGDRYIAMASGPVPSRVYDIVRGNLDYFGDPAAIAEAVRVDRNERWARVYATREPNLDLLSETDVAALHASIEFCRGKSVRALSELTHQEPAWAEAPANAR
jgi:uncharacterized phage-associated protein